MVFGLLGSLIEVVDMQVYSNKKVHLSPPYVYWMKKTRSEVNNHREEYSLPSSFNWITVIIKNTDLPDMSFK